MADLQGISNSPGAQTQLGLRQRFYALFLRSEPVKGYSLLSPTLLVMLLTMGAPFGIMIMMSFWTQTGFDFDTTLTLANYEKAVERPAYGSLLLRSLAISGSCTLATILLSYPMAYFVAFHVHRRKLIWIVLMTLPFWTSYLLRIFTWKVILGFNGAINTGLMTLGLVDAPLEFLLYSPTAVVITLTHAWAAFAILPIYVSLEKIDKSLLEAATDLGDGPVARFFRVTLPLSLPGVFASAILIFIPTVGEYVTPTLVGGPDSLMLGNLIQIQFGTVNNWPMGSTLAICMMLTVGFLATAFYLSTKKLTTRIA